MGAQDYCPIHKIRLDPSWEGRCPYCIKEGRIPPPGAPASVRPAPPPDLHRMQPGAETVVRGGFAPQAAPPGDLTRPGWGPVSDVTRPSPVAAAAGETIVERPPAARAWLVVREGEGAGRWYPLGEETGIGRDRENQIVLLDGKVSRFHAKVRLEKDAEGKEQYVVWDLASKNGTFVNEERVRAPAPIKENDTLRVGGTTFVLKIVE